MMSKMIYIVQDIRNDTMYAYINECDAIRQGLRIYKDWLDSLPCSYEVAASEISEDMTQFVEDNYILDLVNINKVSLIGDNDNEC